MVSPKRGTNLLVPNAKASGGLIASLLKKIGPMGPPCQPHVPPPASLFALHGKKSDDDAMLMVAQRMPKASAAFKKQPASPKAALGAIMASSSAVPLPKEKPSVPLQQKTKGAIGGVAKNKEVP